MSNDMPSTPVPVARKELSMSMLPETMTPQDLSLSIVDHRGEPWLTARELGTALGYRDESAVPRIYARHQDELTEETTLTVKVTVNAGRPDRIFSPRGCDAVGFFAKTDRAKAFRRWVLDVLERHPRGPAAAPAPECRLMPYRALTRGRRGHKLTPNGDNAVSLNMALVLDHLLTHYGDGRWHEISDQRIGDSIGVNRISVLKVRRKLETRGLIERDVAHGRPTRIRVFREKLRQELMGTGEITPRRTEHTPTPKPDDAVPPEVAMVLNYLRTHCGDGQWYEATPQSIGAQLVIRAARVLQVERKLEAWGLIPREGDRPGAPMRIRVLAENLQQELLPLAALPRIGKVH